MSTTAEQPRTAFPDLFAALAEPFASDEVKSRTQAGRKFLYVTARTVMNRLDRVLGPEHWWDRYHPHENSVQCELTIRLPSGEVLTKCDAGGYSGMADQGDDDKSGYSDALKRAAVKFGVGRYLYNDGVPDYESNGHVAPAPAARPHPDVPVPIPGGNPPRTGRALYAWCKDAGQQAGVDLVRALGAWAKAQGYSDRLSDWNDSLVSAGHTEALSLLARAPRPVPAANGHADGGAAPDVPGVLPPRPATGKDLYKLLKDLERDRGCTLVTPCQDAMRARGWTARMVDWADLDAPWLWLHSKAQELGWHGPSAAAGASGPDAPADVPSRLRKALADKLRAICRAVVPGEPDHTPSADELRTEFNYLVHQVSPGEVVESLANCDDAALLQRLCAAADGRLGEIDGIPF